MMMKERDGITTITGKIAEISADRLNFKVKTQVYNKENKTNTDTVVNVVSETPLDATVSVAQDITVAGFLNARTKAYEAMYISTKSGSFDYEKLSVVNGEVMFARLNTEKNPDGSARMTKERTNADGTVIPAHEKKPHFDIAVQTIEPDPEAAEEGATKRVLHIMKIYPFPNRKTKELDFSTIDRMAKLFKDYNHKTEVATVAIITQPGRSYSKENVVGERTYMNNYCDHMGVSALDVISKEKVAERTVENTASAPARPAALPAPSAPAQEGSGFEASEVEADPLEDVFNI